jgi:hypothetical protein
MMWHERLYLCLSLAAAGVLLLAVAAGLEFSASGAEAPAGDWPATFPRDGGARGTAEPKLASSGLPAWLPAFAGAGLLGSAFVLLVRHSISPGYAGPRGARTCRRCRHRLGPEARPDCPKCGAPTRCPRCVTDLTRGGADVCQACGAPWGCPRCGYSLKGLASNPCPSCRAPTLCHRCGTDLHYNITGRCARCGARIAGWREWR